MTPRQYSGRPPKQHRIAVVYGVAATRLFHDGERDAAALSQVGKFKEYTFETVQELNAFILGVEDATGYLDSLFIED